MVNYDVLCIGDAKLDTFLKIEEAEGKFSFDKSTNELKFKHSEKISVDKTYISVGGNAANVVVGLTRLGINATIAAEIGDDEFSLKIVNTLAKENIDRGFIKQTRGTFTSFSVALAYNSDRTLFSQHQVRKHDFNYDFANPKWIYLTSLGDDWESPYQKALNYATSHNIQIAFNPGTIQLSEKFPIINEIISKTNIFFINLEEAKRILFGSNIENAPDDINIILMNIKKLGPRNVVITDGENGSYSLDTNNNYFHQPKIPCTIVELTGAGDAYATGFMAAVIHNLSMQNAMLWGSHNAASVVSNVGAQDGLLRRAQLEEKINGSK